MAVFKCKMCGGNLEVQEKMSVCECVYCGTKQTLPRLNDERRANLYDRANHFRRNNEFDKAMSMYEQILEEDKEDSEAYWSLVLCTYGIEYVEDPVSHKRLPTVNRTQFISIYADENYKAALQYADEYQRQIYEMEAGQIDGLQKQILSISNQEEPFDVFICYKETDNQGRRTQDSVLANDLYHQLTNEGFKVFFSRITLEDKLGSAYEPYIFAALNSAKVMIVLGTRVEYFNAVWVRNEWSRYLALIKSDAKKVLIPAYKDMDPYDLPQEFSHLQAQDMGKLGFMQDLIRGIKKLTGTDRPVQPATAVNMAGGETASLLKRAFLFLEDGDFTRADEFCERVLDIDPENGEAYLGKLMVSLEVRRREDLAYVAGKLEQQEYYHKIMRFGKESLKAEVNGYNQQIIERLEKEEKQRAEQEEQKRAEIYREAVAVIENAQKSYLVQQALEQLKQLRQIGNFSDTTVYIKKAEAKIAKIKKAEAKKNLILVIAFGILLGIIFMTASIYQKAQVKAQIQELIAQGNYSAIYGTFSEMLEPEAAAKETAKTMQQAILTAVEKGEYDKARELLTYGYEYFDVSSGRAFIKAAEGYFKKVEYDAALTLVEGNSLLESDETAQELLQNIYYCQAKEYIAAGDYITASAMLDDLAGYLDSAELRAEIEDERTQQYFRQAERWDIISFGCYEQDGDASNGPEGIEWVVIDRDKDGNLLLLSKYLLDAVPEQYENASSNQDRCWETSDLRIWMNYKFYKSAFSDTEADYIKPTVIQSDEVIAFGGSGDSFIAQYENIEGRVTEDNVFALSLEEVERCFNFMRKGSSLYSCQINDVDYLEGVPTKAMLTLIKEGEIYKGSYCLRTMINRDKISLYDADGQVTIRSSIDYGSYMVRPAIWVSAQPQ